MGILLIQRQHGEKRHCGGDLSPPCSASSSVHHGGTAMDRRTIFTLAFAMTGLVTLRPDGLHAANQEDGSGVVAAGLNNPRGLASALMRPVCRRGRQRRRRTMRRGSRGPGGAWARAARLPGSTSGAVICSASRQGCPRRRSPTAASPRAPTPSRFSDVVAPTSPSGMAVIPPIAPSISVRGRAVRAPRRGP